MATKEQIIAFASGQMRARDQRIADLEQREQRAWLAAWGAEYRAQVRAQRVDGRQLLDAVKAGERLAAQAALLQRAEAALSGLCSAPVTQRWHEAMMAVDAPATLAAIRAAREGQR